MQCNGCLETLVCSPHTSVGGVLIYTYLCTLKCLLVAYYQDVFHITESNKYALV